MPMPPIASAAAILTRGSLSLLKKETSQGIVSIDPMRDRI
jgi:hypothetical protein